MNRSERRKLLKAAQQNGQAPHPARTEVPPAMPAPPQQTETLRGQRVRAFRCEKGHQWQVAEPLRPGMTNALPAYCPGCVQEYFVTLSAKVSEVE